MFRTYFLAGLATLIPIFATLWVLRTLILWADGFFKSFLPAALKPENLFDTTIPGIGIIFTVVTILIVGILTRAYFGKKMVDWWDALFSRIPFGKNIYKTFKQFVEITFSDKSESFKKVALIEYPRAGSWALCFVTGEASGEIQTKTQHKVYSVFLPTTPNPTSGYLLFIPEDELILLNMTTEDAMKIIISAGVVKAQPIAQ